MLTSRNAPGYFQITGNNGKTLDITEDGKLPVEVSIDSVTATDVTIKDATNATQKLKVNADGSIPVQLTGSKVVEEVVVNAQSVAAGGHVEFSMAPTNEDEIWIMVSIDKQPWSLTTSTQVYSGSDGTTDTLYPRRADVTNTFTGVAPATSLFMGGIIYASAFGYSPPSDVREAKARIVPYKSNAKGRVSNKSTETATITVRLLRIWRKS